MANQRPKAVFFIFLLLSAHAYRLETTNEDALEAAVNSSQIPANAVVMAGHEGVQGALQAGYWVVQNSVQTTAFSSVTTATVTSYSSPFHATSVVTTSSGSYTRTSVTAVTEFCAPGMHNPSTFGKYEVIETGATTISPIVPLLLAAGVILMGGLYLYHQHRMNGPVEASFCPVSSWESDPAGMLVGPPAFDAFGENFAPFLSEDNNRGMPKCHGLRRHRLREDCDGDVDCKRQACRQMCCDRRDCTFFQFNTIDSTDNCWLGSRSRLSTSTCEQPFFGETCTTCRDRRGELWHQIHEDNMKCHSAVIGFTGFTSRISTSARLMLRSRVMNTTSMMRSGTSARPKQLATVHQAILCTIGRSSQAMTCRHRSQQQPDLHQIKRFGSSSRSCFMRIEA